MQLQIRIIVLSSIFLFILLQSCLKRNIYSGIGAGGGVITDGGTTVAAGITKLRISPGNFDEYVSGIIDIYNVYRFSDDEGNFTTRFKDFFPVVGGSLLFNFIDIDETVNPYMGIGLNVVLSRKQKALDISSELNIIVGVEQILSKNFSFFYEFPVNIMRGQTLTPKYSFIFGISYYFKRKD